MCATRSHTDARTWDTAAPLRGVGGGRSPWGVAPRLLRLSNGLLALTTGRPGLMLWVTPDDGQPLSGWKAWSIAANHNRQLPSLRFTSHCSHYGATDCQQPAGADVPGRAGRGSTTSYTGLTVAESGNSTSSSILVSYDWLAN
eukprot:COSAG04_NODE_18952_length_428_cov_1.085106_1_plen_142_part_11